MAGRGGARMLPVCACTRLSVPKGKCYPDRKALTSLTSISLYRLARFTQKREFDNVGQSYLHSNFTVNWAEEMEQANGSLPSSTGPRVVLALVVPGPSSATIASNSNTHPTVATPTTQPLTTNTIAATPGTQPLTANPTAATPSTQPSTVNSTTTTPRIQASTLAATACMQLWGQVPVPRPPLPVSALL